MLRFYLLTFILIPPIILSYPSFWSPLLAAITAAYSWTAFNSTNYKLSIHPIRGHIAAMLALLINFVIISSFEDIRHFFYFSICLLAYFSGLIINHKKNRLDKVGKIITLAALIYLSLIATSLNVSDGAGIRSNYIGVAILTCALLWSNDYRNGNAKWLLLIAICVLAYISSTRSILVGLAISLIINFIPSWRTAALLVLLSIICIFFANTNLDAILNNYFTSVQEISIEYSGKALDTGRSGLWLTAVENMSATNVMFGYSPEELAFLNIDPNGVHNGYLYLFLSKGLGALILFAIIIFLLIKHLWITRGHLLSILMVAILIKECFEVTLLAGNLAFAVPFWLYCGMAAKKYISERRNEKYQ